MLSFQTQREFNHNAPIAHMTYLTIQEGYNEPKTYSNSILITTLQQRCVNLLGFL